MLMIHFCRMELAYRRHDKHRCCRRFFSMSANGLTITVGGGTAFINGRYGYNNDSTTVQLDAETITNQRIDRIVLELDVPNRKIELKVVKGTAASSGAAGTGLTQNENIYQVPLYQALITEGSTGFFN